jgi:MerR HTH family regulatory protein
MTSYSTQQVEKILDISTRKLDHLIRSGVLPPGPGSGQKRRWTEDTIRRLDVAKALDDASPQIGHEGMSLWPVLAAAALKGPEPMIGWVRVGNANELEYFSVLAPPTDGLFAFWKGLRVETEAKKVEAAEAAEGTEEAV